MERNRPEHNTYFRAKRFARMKRQMSAMIDEGREIPGEMVQKHRELDQWLAMNRPGWMPNYKQNRK